MAANFKPLFELIPINAGITIVNADASTVKTILTAGVNGCRIDGVLISSDDTAAVNLAFSIDISGTNYYIGNVLVPIGSGYTTVVRVDAIVTLAPANQTFIQMPSGAKLEVNAVATVTSGKTVTIIAIGGNF